MAKPIYILNGPNLNLLGIREPAIYGAKTLDTIKEISEARAASLGYGVEFRQSNSEGELIGWIQEAGENASGLIINAGAYTHTSIAMLDALRAVAVPCVEVHLSNIFQRETFRHESYISKASAGVICGFGPKGYELAVEALAEIVDHAE